ncbi:hypothetical protein TKK_0009283 [Trichogramma kaykai]
MVESMLRRGADPSLANEEGLTPLHLIARRDVNGDAIEIFFRMNEKRLQTVRIDARDDKSGRTELEWAVASCLPMAVKSFLDCGADLSGFVFPTPRDSDEGWYQNVRDKRFHVAKLTDATGLLAIVELLEARGYEMNRDDACCVRLYEKISTKFCRDWALDPFMELIHYRLPTESCEIVIEKLKNEDLFNICLAAAGRSSRQ